MEETKRCKYCGEEILAIAIKCKHCSSMLDENKNDDHSDSEQILADRAANLFRGIESVGGRILITNKSITFKSHALNLQKMDLIVSLKDIAKVEKRNTMGIVPNGLLLKLKSGVEYKFVVWNREELISILSKATN